MIIKRISFKFFLKRCELAKIIAIASNHINIIICSSQFTKQQKLSAIEKCEKWKEESLKNINNFFNKEIYIKYSMRFFYRNMWE